MNAIPSQCMRYSCRLLKLNLRTPYARSKDRPLDLSDFYDNHHTCIPPGAISFLSKKQNNFFFHFAHTHLVLQHEHSKKIYLHSTRKNVQLETSTKKYGKRIESV